MYLRYFKNMKKNILRLLTHTDSETKANALNDQFVSVFTIEDHIPLPCITGNPSPDIS